MVIVILTLILLSEIYCNLYKHLEISLIVKKMIEIVKIWMELKVMMINMIKILMKNIILTNIMWMLLMSL
jgi:hypothetical protein